MKLLNQSLKHLSIAIFVIVSVWAVVFYISMLNEIKSSIDEGLENHTRLIQKNAESDSTVLLKSTFDESLFTVREITSPQIFAPSEHYTDTFLYMQDIDDGTPEWEPVRMMTSTFLLKGKYYELKVANSMVEEDDLMESLFWKIIWLYILLIALVTIINNIILKKLWKPFYEFLFQLKKYQLGKDNSLPAVVSHTTEFNDLQKAVKVLLQNNIQIYEQQKQFIENAAHELQTPLAIATNRIELLVEKGTLDDKAAKDVAEVFQIIQRMIRLNKSLLLLSKIENKQFSTLKSYSLNNLVKEKVEEMSELWEYKNVNISFSENGQFVVPIDEALAGILLDNLLRNALLHNVPEGSINVLVTEGLLQICNTGVDKSLDSRKIFQRFQKFDKTAGAGLGLAISKAIADHHGLFIRYFFRNGLHCFEIGMHRSAGSK